ncbi:sugar phosphate isomerase/epimerase family protein [Tessaracoccus sp. Z1128]
MTDELFATCWTTAGDVSPMEADKQSPVDFRERVEVTSAAGFMGMGFLLCDLEVAEAKYGIDGMRKILADNGIRRWETELLQNWWGPGPQRAESDANRTAMLRYLEELGGYDLKVAPDDSGEDWSMDQWAAEFAVLATETANVGARLGIEFLPWMNIATITDGLALVEAAGHPNGGLIVDVWHTERAATPHEVVAACPVERIVGIELSDASAVMVGDWLPDTVKNRRLPGEGDFDLKGVVAALRATGWNGPWGVEILSSTHRKLPVAEAARRAFESTQTLLCS